MFNIGDKVQKPKGYKFDGTVVAVFTTTAGETRVVAELDGNGMLHIFAPNQLEHRHICGVCKNQSSHKGICSDACKHAVS